MYSIVMVAAMAGAPEVPAWGHHNNGCNGGHGGCHGTPVVVQSHSTGCTGYNGCNGCNGGGHIFGHRLKSCFSGLFHRSNGCHGGSGCHGSTIATSAPVECGTVVIPPKHHHEGTHETPKNPVKEMPKVKPVDPKLGPAPVAPVPKKIGQ